MLKKTEKKLAQFVVLTTKHPIITLVIAVALSLTFLSHAPQVKLDTSTEGFLHPDDPYLVQYNKFRNEFGREEMIIATVRSSDIFKLEHLMTLKSLHLELEQSVPYVDEVISLYNARYTHGKDDALYVDNLLEQYLESLISWNDFVTITRNNPLYQNMLISADGVMTAVLIRTQASVTDAKDPPDWLSTFSEDGEAIIAPPDASSYISDTQNAESVAAVRRIAAKYNAADFMVKIAGTPVLIDDLKVSMKKNMRIFMVLSIATVALCLFLIFRKWTGVILPLLTVLLSVLTVVGLMALFDTPIKIPTQILPSFLLAICICDSVHLLAIFYKRFYVTGNKTESIIYSVTHSGLALIMTSITTAAGLLSFAFADISPISDLGKYGAVGVIIALINTLVVLPPLIVLSPVKFSQKSHPSESVKLDSILTSIALLSVKHSYKIILMAAIFIIIGTAGITRIKFSHNPLKWLPPDMPISVATQEIDEKLRGTATMEAVVNTGVDYKLYEPDILNKIDTINSYLTSIQYGDVFVGKVVSIVDIVKEVHQALHDDDQEYYTIPSTRQAVAQEMLLFENSGSDDLTKVTDTLYKKARFTIKVPWLDAIDYNSLYHLIKQRFTETFTDVQEIELTGVLVLLGRTLTATMESTRTSYLIAFVAITIMIVFLIGDIKLSLICMIPNFFPILIVLGYMGFANIPLDMFTMLIGSIAIGLAVDDTIHFMHNFRKYYDLTGDTTLAIRETLLGAGKAMIITSIILTFGFFIYLFSMMGNLRNFGFLTGLAILMALMADLLLLPALLVVVTKQRSIHGDHQELRRTIQ